MEYNEFFADEFFPPTEEEFLEMLKHLKSKLENPKYRDQWVNLSIQYKEIKQKLEDLGYEYVEGF